MHSLLPSDHFVCHPNDMVPADDVPPPPPPRTTSIRCRPAVVSKSLVNLAPSSTCSVSGRSCRRSAPHPRHVHSSSSSSSSSNDTFLESLRRDFSVPEFRNLRSLPSSSECVASPAARSDCSSNSSGVVTCPSLSSLSGGSPDTTKGLIARSISKPVKQPERQFVHSADLSNDTSPTGVTRSQSVQCVSRAFERLSVVSSGGTSSSSGTGVSSDSAGESCGPVCRTVRDESPPPPLPPKLFLTRATQSSLRFPDTGPVQNKQQQVRTTGSKRKESETRNRSRCVTTVNHSENHRQVRLNSTASKNNALSIGVSASSKSSDRRTCEKSGNRMIYLDALRRVKTSDTEIRAIQKRALMEFYFNCFKEDTTKNHTPESLSPDRSASPPTQSLDTILPPAAVSISSSSSHCEQSPPFQTALPARVLAGDSEDEAAVNDMVRQSCHKEAGMELRKADVCTKDASDQMSELEITLQRKHTLLRDLKLNQMQSSKLMSEMTSQLSAHQIEKISRCSEITVATQLVLSLRSRLKSLEENMDNRNSLLDNHQQVCSDKNISDESGIGIGIGVSPDRSGDKVFAHSSSSPSSPESSDANDVRDVLRRKKYKLQLQLDEAMSLKDMITLRSHRIRQEILSKSSDGKEESESNPSIQYISLMFSMSELLTEISDVSERINSLQRQTSVTSDLT